MNDSLGALLAIVFIWLVVKFAFGGSSPRSSDPTTGPPVTEGPGLGRNRPVPQEMVDSLTSMFPHIPEPSIRYDLQRTGSVDVTCERILTEGRLPEPPTGFFPPISTPQTQPQNTTTNTNTTNLATPNSKASSSKKSPSLISRFGLESKLNANGNGGNGVDEGDESLGNVSMESLKGKEREKVGGWGEEKVEREKRLRERKEKMILDARRRMQEKASTSPKASAQV